LDLLANAGIFTVRPHAVLYCIFLAALSASCISDRTENAPITIPKMDRRIQEIVTQGNLPSVQIAIIERNKVAWSKAMGQNTGTDFVYMNGSVQKVFDATDIVFFPPWIVLAFSVAVILARMFMKRRGIPKVPQECCHKCCRY
jgi:hypothetical protein